MMAAGLPYSGDTDLSDTSERRTGALPLPYRKMNGLGNAFAVLDARDAAVRAGLARLDEAAIARLARPEVIGFDQFILLEPPRDSAADVFMRIRNADGGEVEACGNATRCVGWLVAGETGRDSVAIETVAGLLRARSVGDHRVSVDMGRPRLGWQEIPLSEEFHDTSAIELEIGPRGAPVLHSPAVVNVGNPHAIFFVDRDVESFGLERWGPMIEHHPLFPERVNVSLAQRLSPREMRLKVWERGVGLTEACGTAACAAAVAGARRGLTERAVAVHLPGGVLDIEWRADDDRIMMTGGLEDEGPGEITDAMLAGDAARGTA